MAVLTMHAPIRIPLLVALVLGAVGCDFTRAPTALEVDGPTLGVHAVMEAGAPAVDVLVTWTRVVAGADAPVTEPALGASVRLIRGTDTLAAGALPSGASSCALPPFGDDGQELRAGCYRVNLPGGVLPQERYGLLVDVAGRAVTGAATVPASPVVDAPFAGDTLWVGATGPDPSTSDAVTVAWAPAGGRYMELSFGSATSACEVYIQKPGEDVGQAWLEVQDAVTATVAPYALACGQDAPDVVPAYLYVAAFDTAYARYARDRARGGNSVPAERASPGLVGAVGVFGGAATVGVPLFLRAR
ncbi:MAG: hypothetical protein WEA24_06915 [Gemmatimonadota bacterium]